MTKEEMLRIMRLLSGMESLMYYKAPELTKLPEYLLEDVDACVKILEREILK